MLFSSISFIYYFLAITLLFYFIIPSNQIKNGLLLLASFIFYFVGEPKYCLLMLGSILVGYIGGLVIEKFHTKISVGIFVFAQLGLLGIFKYSDFAIDIANKVFQSEINFLRLALPIGISFYSFQIISYLVDVYRKDVKAEKNPIYLGAYVTMFPQLIAGPIVRFQTIQEELRNRKIKMESISEGAFRFVIGLGKKVILADNLGELITRFDELESMSIFSYWTVAIMYMLQIYYDFAGYSDMAIGLGKILGFRFPENFHYPFESKSITEFWRRWHMTLGSFLRDYIFIPLGGSRCNKYRNIINILIVWFLSGLWHGAAINFVIWGLFFGLFLVLEKFTLKKILEKIPNWSKHIYSLFLLIISFVIFRFDDLSVGVNYLLNMFKMTNINLNIVEIYELKNVAILLIISIIGATSIMKKLADKVKLKIHNSVVVEVLEMLYMVAILLVVTAFLIQSSVHPFLYFRF